MVSFDVKSLFTFIPVDLAVTITKERLQQDQNVAERTNMSVSNVMKLLEFVLTNNYFKHDGHFLGVQWVPQSVLCWPTS